MEATPEGHETEMRPPQAGLLAPDNAADAGTRWMGHLDWGPSHMLNDMGPATVILTADDIEQEAAALTVRSAVERAIEKGEEYEYDE